MAYERGSFGVEYDPRRIKKDSSPVVGWVVLLLVLLAAVSLCWTLLARLRSSSSAETPPKPPAEIAAPQNAEAVSAPVVEPHVREMIHESAQERVRPVAVRNLLMRLAEAERKRDIEMAISTIEQIRALPGQPAADLDDALARRLGVLNIKRLFVLRSSQWVKTVVVERGDSASRIAAENGATLASLNCLNGGSVDKIIIGAKLYVMNHPRFNLVVRRRSRTADLSLNGKFFKRYDLSSAAQAADGAYELPQRTATFWKNLGLGFSPADRTEIETLMPVGSPVLISEL